MKFPVSEFSASKEKCDVHIGKNYFSGDLSNYKIHVEFEDFSCDVELKNSLLFLGDQKLESDVIMTKNLTGL